MEIFEIVIDSNEADTSQDELEEDEKEIQRLSIPRMNVQKIRIDATETRDEEISRVFQNWERPKDPAGLLLYSSSDLQEQPEAFQFFFIDSTSTISKIKHPKIQINSSVQELPLHNVIRLFGVTKVPKTCMSTNEDTDFMQDEEENFAASVCVNVHGFLPYFYALPTGKLGQDRSYWMSSNIDDFIAYLDGKVEMEILKDPSCTEYHEFVTNSKCIVSVEPLRVSDVEDKIYHFHGSRNKFNSNGVVLKIFCSLPRFVWKAQKVLDADFMMYDGSLFQCFENNINNNIRFLTDQGISGCSWMEVTAGSYFQRNDQFTTNSSTCPSKESHSQIEIDVHFDNLKTLPKNHKRYSNGDPPVRILSFDIEVMSNSKTDVRCKDHNLPVIQIGNILGNYCTGKGPTECIIGKTIFVLGTCDPIPDAKVIQFYIEKTPCKSEEECFKTAEAAMLGAWRDFVVRMDPDIIIGYNIKKFDIPYLFDRAKDSINSNSTRLPFLGRMKKIKSQIRKIENCIKKGHHYDENSIDIQGRVILDLFPILMRHDRGGGGTGYFKLSNVAKRCLGKEEEKHDIDYKDIEGLQKGNSTTRNKLAKYCLQDCMIPLLLLFKPVPARSDGIKLIELYFGKSQSGGNLVRYLLNKSLYYNEYFLQIKSTRLPANPST